MNRYFSVTPDMKQYRERAVRVDYQYKIENEPHDLDLIII